MVELSMTHIWILAAIVLATFEVFIPGFAIMCAAVGALGAGIAAALGGSLLMQGGVFCGATLLSAITLRPLALKFLYAPSEEIATNAAALIGKRAKVVEEIPGNMEKGRVKVEGQEWNAISEVDLPIPTNSYVIVKGIDGNKLIVEMEKQH